MARQKKNKSPGLISKRTARFLGFIKDKHDVAKLYLYYVWPSVNAVDHQGYPAPTRYVVVAIMEDIKTGKTQAAAYPGNASGEISSYMQLSATVRPCEKPGIVMQKLGYRILKDEEKEDKSNHFKMF